MKNIFLLIAVAFGLSFVNAQVGVETSTVRGDGAMDFPSPATKGILVPLVTNTSAVPAVGGAIAYNLATKRVEFYDVGKGAWDGMSVAATESVTITGPEHAGTTGRFTELDPSNGTIIEAGTATSEAPVGALSIESDDKALILPQVTDATLLPSPKAGMICYDMASDSIAVFNGEVWSFFN